MDERPFLEFDLTDIKEPVVEELKNLTKSAFDLDTVLSTAHDLKYLKALRNYLSKQWQEPDEEFVRFMAGQVYDGRLTKGVREQLRPVVQRAPQQFVSDKVSGRLMSALREEEAATSVAEPEDEGQEQESEDGIVTTEEEKEGYRIVRAIMREVVDVERVVLRDVKTYCGVLLDDNNRQPICRLHFNSSQKYLGIFDEEKNEEREPIDSLDEIYDYAEELRAAIGYYDD